MCTSDEGERALANFDQDVLDAEISRPPSQNREFSWVNLAIHLVHEWEVYSRQELDIWRGIRVVLATGNLETVDAVLVDGLSDLCGQQSLQGVQSRQLTCPGPMIVPFQLLIIISSPSSSPYEQEPSPMPFSPFSSSSSSLKFLGTVLEMRSSRI